MNEFKKIQALACNLLERAGLNRNIKIIEPIYAGANNRSFHIKTNSDEFILKKYFQDKIDPNKRVVTEFSFLNYCQQKVPGKTPLPIYMDVDLSAGICEFIYGVKVLSPNQIGDALINQAAEFIYELNRENIGSCELNHAKEACFSIEEHLMTIENRISELNYIKNKDANFTSILTSLNKLWDITKTDILKDCHINNISIAKKIDESSKIISPSDFGFHNVIIKPDGSLCFIDFEYAGIDDPAKMVGDFFNQVAIPVKSSYLESFMSNAFNNKIDKIRYHCLRLLPLYKVKWLCIILNIYCIENSNRRLFSNPSLNIKKIKTNQIKLAKKILNEYSRKDKRHERI